MHNIRTIFVGKRSIFILIVSGLLVINAIWVIPTLRSARTSASVFALTVAERIQSEINSSLGNALDDITGVSSEIADEPEQTIVTFQNLLRYHSIFSTLSLVDRSGKEFVRVDSSGPLPPEKFIDQSRNTAFYLALQGRTTFTSPIILPNGEAHITLAAPVPKKGEFIDEVIIAELNIQNLLSIIQSPKIGQGHAYVLDRDGIEILHPDPAIILKHQDLSARPIVKKVLVDGATADGLAQDDAYVNEKGEDTFTVGVPIPVVKWGVFVEQPRWQALASQQQAIILAIITSVLAIVIFLWIARTTIKLRELTKQLQTGAGNVYKQSAEIAGKNKTLSLLNTLYEISVLSLEPKEIATRVSKTIQEDMAFDLVGILLCHRLEEELTPIAFASSERLYKIQSNFNIFFESVSIPLSSSNFLKNVIQSAKMSYTEAPTDIWGNLISKEMSVKIQSDGHVKSSFAHPLISRDTVIGVLLFSLNRPRDQLLDYESEPIQSFVNVIAVAIDKALLTDELQTANAGQVSLMHSMNHQVKGKLGNNQIVFDELLHNPDYSAVPNTTGVKKLLEQGIADSTTGIEYVQKILRSASAHNGTLPYEMKPMDMKTLVEELVAKEKVIGEQKGLSFETHIADGDYTMTGDATQLGEAFRDLVENAIKYNNPNGSVAVTLSRTNQKILFMVKDTGKGIPKDDEPRLYKPGGMGKDSMKYNTDAAGFGLAFVKPVIEKHGGKIWHESNSPENGTTFFVELPVKGE